MKNNKEIEPKNSKDEFHGYQEWYWDKDCTLLWYRGKYRNGIEIGYEECHSDNHAHTYSEASFFIR